jgi:hypothetical protein
LKNFIYIDHKDYYILSKMGKSYRRRHYYDVYDPEYDRRCLKKDTSIDCQKHGKNLIVKRGEKTLLCHCGKKGCTDEYDFKEHSSIHFLKQLVKCEVREMEN